MNWVKPLLVFVYGYGACFVTLCVIMLSIMVTKKLMQWIHERPKKEKDLVKV